MIDYLKFEDNLKPFYDYKAEKEYKRKIHKFEKIFFSIFLFLLILSTVIIYIFLKDIFIFLKELFGEFFFLLSAVVMTIIYMIILIEFYPDKNFLTNNYETEENLKKLSKFGIKNVTNFKENIALLKTKTEYMIFDEKFKRAKDYPAKEIYINKILNVFYGNDKLDLKKQDMELLELLKR